MVNSTYTRNSSSESDTDNTADNIARILNAIVLSITVFILISLIVYGTRKKRWMTSPGGSSLHSGITFTSCVIAISLTLPRLIVNELIHYMRMSNKNVIMDCSVAANISGAFYFIPQCGIYIFLCLLLYKIYVHPCVRDKVKKCWQSFIPIFTIVSVIMIIAAAVLTVHSIPVTWQPDRGCRYSSTGSASLPAGLVSLGWVIIQTFMVSLYINAAFRTYPVSKADTDSDEHEDCGSHCADRCRIICPCGSKNTVLHSPVELAVKRSVYSVMVIVVSDVTMTIITVYILPRAGVHTFPSPLLDLSVLINIFCVIGALGCAGEALGWWLPKCRKAVSNPARK